MKLDCSEIIKNLHGKPIDFMGSNATLGVLIGEAFAYNYKDETLSDLQTRIRWDQAVEFAKAKTLDVDKKLIEETKDLVNKRWPLGIAGPTLTALINQLEDQAPKKGKNGKAA